MNAKYGNVLGDNFEDTDKAIVIVKDQLDLLAKLFYKFDTTLYFNGTTLQKLDCLNRAAEYTQLTEEIEKRFMAIVKKLRSAYDLCCNSEDISEEERDYVHFYFAIKAIIHKLNKGDAPDTAQMNDRVRIMIQEALISDGVEEVFKLDQNQQFPF
jgi:type I restriction enzyme R subunit